MKKCIVGMWCLSWYTTVQKRPQLLLIQLGTIVKWLIYFSLILFILVFFEFIFILWICYFIFNSSKHLIEFLNGRCSCSVFTLILGREALLFKRNKRYDREHRSEILWLKHVGRKRWWILAQVGSILFFF